MSTAVRSRTNDSGSSPNGIRGNGRRDPPRRAIWLGCVVALAAPATASAADYYVEPGGMGTTGSSCAQAAPCPTIHAAVLASEASGAADTIHVASGTYSTPDDALFGGADTSLTVVGTGDATVITSSATAVGVLAIQGAEVTLRSLRVLSPVNVAQPAVVIGSSSMLHLDHATVDVAQSNTGMNLHAISVGFLGTATLDNVNATVGARGQVLENNGATTVRNSTLNQNNADISSAVVRALNGQLVIQDSELRQNAPTANNTAVVVQSTGMNQPIGVRLDDDLILGGATSFSTAEIQAGSPISLALNNDTLAPRLTSSPLIDDASLVASSVLVTLDSNIIRATLPALTDVVSSGCAYNDFPTGVTPGYVCTNTTNSDASSLFSGTGFDIAAGSAAVDSGDPAAIAGEPATDVAGRTRFSRSDGGCGAGRRDRGAYELQNAGVAPTLSLSAPDTALVGQAVTFTPAASGSPSFAWSFGDGATSTVAGPTTHSYPAAGTYSASLTVSAGGGCTAIATRVVNVLAVGGHVDTFTLKPVLSVKKPGKVKKGKSVKLKITLSVAATVAGKACRKVGKHTTCVRFSKPAAPGSKTLSVLAGKLKAGRYTLTVTATDASHNVSKTVTLHLTVTR